MILEEITGEAIFSVTRDNKSVQLAVGDSFTEEEFLTRTVTGKTGKAVIRVDQNCTVEIGAVPAPETETVVVARTTVPTAVKTKAEPAVVETPAVE